MHKVFRPLILAVLMTFFMSFAVYADSSIEISAPADLVAIPNGSTQSYVLTNDIDMKGINWTPKDFCGCLDGQGYTIFNLTANGHSEKTDLSYDGNMKVYETYGGGLFGHLDGATIRNLNLLGFNMKCYYQYDNSEGSKDPSGLFLGSIAGFMNQSTIENVHIEGRGYIKTNAKNFGIGGFAGFGNGVIKDSSCNVELTSIDTDKAVRDEQFLGGAYAAGAIDLINNQVVLQGFDSDHGYVHSGGLVGMYIHYYSNVPYGHIDNNNIEGRITFFEDNKNRRAYCEAYIGEIMCWNLTMDHNNQNFIRNEVFDYSKDLLPHDCEKAHWVSRVVEPTEVSYGFTDYQCSTCGYEYRGSYTLWQEPVPAPVETEPAVEIQIRGSSQNNMKKLGLIGIVFCSTALLIVIIVTIKKNRHGKTKRNI